MHEKQIIEELLTAKGVTLAGPIISDQDATVTFFAFVNVSLDNEGRRVPSAFTLNRVSSEAKEANIHVSFVLIDGDRDDLDSSLKTMLFGKFPDFVRNSFATFEQNKADVWIEPRRAITDALRTDLGKAIGDFLSFLSIELKSINITRAENVPTPTAILRAIRTISPNSVTEIARVLKQKGFAVPNDVWMNHALDKQRKSGKILRKKNGQYVLTLEGLTSMGTRKNRASPDVARALALARREA
jgi:hypothetical protein